MSNLHLLLKKTKTKKNKTNSHLYNHVYIFERKSNLIVKEMQNVFKGTCFLK